MQIHEVAEQIPAATAKLAIANVLAVLGSQSDWSADTLDDVAAAVAAAHPKGLPSIFDQDDEAVAFWEKLR
jgi:hypothetical protein